MTERTKTSVRLDADVVEIIANYANTFTNGDKTKALNELVRVAQASKATQETPDNDPTPDATQSHPEPPSNDLLDRVVSELEQLKVKVSEIEQKLDKPPVEDIATHSATLEVGDKVDTSHPIYITLMHSEYVEQECKKERKKYKVRWYQSLGLVVVALAVKDETVFDILAKVDPGIPVTLGDDGRFLY